MNTVSTHSTILKNSSKTMQLPQYQIQPFLMKSCTRGIVITRELTLYKRYLFLFKGFAF